MSNRNVRTIIIPHIVDQLRRSLRLNLASNERSPFLSPSHAQLHPSLSLFMVHGHAALVRARALSKKRYTSLQRANLLFSLSPPLACVRCARQKMRACFIPRIGRGRRRRRTARLVCGSARTCARKSKSRMPARLARELGCCSVASPVCMYAHAIECLF